MRLNTKSSKFVLVLLFCVFAHSQQISKNHGNHLLRYPFANVIEARFDPEEDMQSIVKQCDDSDFSDKNRLKMILSGIADDTLDQLNEKRGMYRNRDSNGDSNLSIKTVQSPLCTCVSHSNLIDLGRSHFPRYLKTFVCNESMCLGCQKRTYFVHILRPRVPNDDNSSSLTESIQQVPKEINKDWMFVQKEIVIGCECMSKRSNDKTK